MGNQIIPIQAPTQHHLPIADIIDDIVLLKDGGAALVMQTTSVNFSLLSSEEQDILTESYAALLNSLSFPIQILVRSRRKNISDYVNFLEEKEKTQTNEKLKKLMTSYQKFVSQMVKKKNVLAKQFFIVIPFSPLELGISFNTFLPFPKKNEKLPYTKDYIIKKAKTSLYPKRDHLIRQSRRVGIKIRQLTTKELIKLFMYIYHPNSDMYKEKEVNGKPKR